MSRLQKFALYCAIGCLSAAAIFAIGVVLIGDFNEFELKALLTAVTIGFASICILVSAAYRHPVLGPKIGYLAIALQLLATVMLIAGIWVETWDVPFWQCTWILVTLGIGLAHALGLLSARLRRGQRWLQYFAAVLIFILCGLISFLIVDIVGDLWKGDLLMKVLTVLSILTALATLVIPILHVIAKAHRSKEQGALVLMPSGDGTFLSRDGRRFEVREIKPG